MNNAINHADDNELCDAIKNINKLIQETSATDPDKIARLRESKRVIIQELGERIAWAMSEG